jgi:exonuclease VII small subunit
MTSAAEMGYSASMAEVEEIIKQIKASSSPDELPELVQRARGLLSTCEQALKQITTRTNAALQGDYDGTGAQPVSTPA